MGTSGPDVIYALQANDLVCAGDGGGDDDMLGGDGQDLLDGGPHVLGDRGNGQAGNDIGCPATETVISC